MEIADEDPGDFKTQYMSYDRQNEILFENHPNYYRDPRYATATQ